MIADLVQIVFGGLAGVGCLYLAVATGLARRWPTARAVAPEPLPPVTLLKPLHGTDPGLADRLRGFCRQTYAAPVQIVFGVQDAADPAIAVVERLRAEADAVDIALVVDRRLHGANRKVSNLANMMRHARHHVLVLSDADMVVGPDYLATAVAELSRPGVGAVTFLYTGIAAAGVWSRLGSLAISAHFLPSVLVGLATGLARPCFGSTIVLTRETLEAIGGFPAVADRLADDYAIGDLVRARGLTVAVPPAAIGHVFSEGSFAELMRHELRWARTVRLLDPAGAAGSIVTHPFPLALIGAAAGSWTCLALAALALVLRLMLCRTVERRFAGERTNGWLLPIREILSPAILVASFFGRGVTWNNLAYSVAADGRLTLQQE
ncbi:bacteriohopanetetrol glucosamine biosynthesis glycosyltransferase HpnI [Jiella sp. M17.18]|uniref:bacteriohopanetetrol glucosamine biosynthesis glycosyltransferase HpnI n=1 Tax=Jiella sp. M17.18 TaxID=3234247 RepID=UPI0034DDE517